MPKSKGKKGGKSRRSRGKGAPARAGAPASADVDGSGASGSGGDPPPSRSAAAADERARHAALGVHIAHVARCRPPSRSEGPSGPLSPSDHAQMRRRAAERHPWLLGIERFDPSDYEPEDLEGVPEVAVDDGGGDCGDCGDCDGEGSRMTLSLTNVGEDTKIYFVTVYDVDLCGADGETLTSGVATVAAAEGEAAEVTERKCTTFVALCPPETFVHLCCVAPGQTLGGTEEEAPVTSWSQVEIESDVQPWSHHPDVDDEHPRSIGFPFDDDDVAHRCTQSECGELTHFFRGNYHAIDFACPPGTRLRSPVDGVVVDVRDGTRVGGIAARNLFEWNSVMIRADEGADDGGSNDDGVDDSNDSRDVRGGPLYVEFVHIRSGSCLVQVGDAVTKGQAICESGSAGFSPEPHLHLAAYRSGDDDAPTVRVRFERAGPGRDGTGGREGTREGTRDGEDGPRSFLPVAGGRYDRRGSVP